jgi:hypothetical protein
VVAAWRFGIKQAATTEPRAYPQRIYDSLHSAPG